MQFLSQVKALVTLPNGHEETVVVVGEYINSDSIAEAYIRKHNPVTRPTLPRQEPDYVKPGQLVVDIIEEADYIDLRDFEED